MPVKLGAAAAGAVTTVSAVADEAITGGEPVFVKSDGKTIGAATNLDTDGESVAEQPVRSDYSGYTWYNNRIFIDLAAGRGIYVGTAKQNHESGDVAKLKELEVNTTTGDITAGGYNGQPDSNYYDNTQGGGYFMDCLWSATQKSWIMVSRGNYDPGAGRAAYDLCFERWRFATDSQRTHTAIYKGIFTIASAGAEYQAATTGASYGAGGLVLDPRNDKIYFFSVGSSNTYGKNCVQMHWIDWAADADIATSDAKNRVTAGYTHGSLTTSCRGCFDSLRNQVVIATVSDSTGYIDLVAFTVTEAGGITYSHSSTNAHHMQATAARGYYVADIEMDAAGNYCVMGGDHNVYVGKNTGSAFTPSSAAVTRPATAVGYAVAMKYFPVYDQWTGIWLKDITSNTNDQDPTYIKQWQVADGVAGTKTAERENKSRWASRPYTRYCGPTNTADNNGYAHGRGGLPGALTSNGVFYSAGGVGPQSYVWNSYQNANWVYRNGIRISASSTNTYLGVANADIADGATGEILVAGAEREGYSGLIPGSSYSALDTNGSLVLSSSLTDSQKLSAHFVGTATSPTKLLIGQDVLPPTKKARPGITNPVAASSLVPGRFCRTFNNEATAQQVTNAVKYDYTTSGMKTALNVMGSGIWTCGLLVQGSDLTTATVKVTIDDVVVLDDTQNPASYYGMAQCGSLYVSNTTASSSLGLVFTEGHIPFNESLKVEVSANTGCDYLYNYILT